MLHPFFEQADAYWSRFLGCEVAHLYGTEPVIAVRREEIAKAVVFVLQRENHGPVVSVPEGLPSTVAESLALAAYNGLELDDRWREILGSSFESGFGPSWIGYGTVESLRLTEARPEVRPLGADDANSLRRLFAVCDQVELTNVGSLQTATEIVGAFLKGELAGVAGYQAWNDSIAHLAVLTHPVHRGEGLGGDLISEATRRASARGLLPQYRSLLSNVASRALASRLGFASYGRSLILRRSAAADA